MKKITVALTNDEYAKLKAVAERSFRSVSSQAALAIAVYMKRRVIDDEPKERPENAA
jgi:predicted transcriptional regulator